MIFSVLGANGAGKSLLIRELIKEREDLYPFSISNCAQAQPSTRLTRLNDNVENRIIDLLNKWGYCYSRSFYENGRHHFLEEGFLTKLLARCPIDLEGTSKFEKLVFKHFDDIQKIESEYVDFYIFLDVRIESWRKQIVKRGDILTAADAMGYRFLCQQRILRTFADQYFPHCLSLKSSSDDDLIQLKTWVDLRVFGAA